MRGLLTVVQGARLLCAGQGNDHDHYSMDDEMMPQPTLQELWVAHLAEPAPDLTGVTAAGVDVPALVSQVSDAVGRAASGSGPLDYARTGLLRHSYAQLWAVDDAVPGAAQAWLDRLRDMTRLILEDATADLL
jgi:hypothetical protein